jgi:hypothetical protein
MNLDGDLVVYLTWGTFADGNFTMFRRAKLMLDDLPRDAALCTAEDAGAPRLVATARRSRT